MAERRNVRNTCPDCAWFVTGRLFFRCLRCALAEAADRNRQEVTRG